MFLRGFTLSLATLMAFGMLADNAGADHPRKPRRIIIQDEYYSGPAFVRELPGLRIFFGDYALSEEEFEDLYGTDRRRPRYDDDFYEQQQIQPKRRANREKNEQPPKKKQATKQAKPVAGAAKKAPTKTASAASALTCEKASSVVSGYGFTSVTPSSCSGKVYTFNATRDGKSFAIKLNPSSGELTEVKKLP